MCTLAFASCATTKVLYPPPPTVEKVDFEKFLGTWYEIAAFPQNYARSCYGTRLSYEPRKENEFSVVRTCTRGGFDGPVDIAQGRMRIADQTSNAKFKLSFFGPVWLDYWLIELATDYSYAVLATPNRDSLWILSRTPELDPRIYSAIVRRLVGLNFDVGRLTITPQLPSSNQ